MGTIHQLLHGYKGGHRLLEGSTRRLKPPDERLVLGLSDASGSRFGPGMASYLTGYPLGVAYTVFF